MLKKENRKIVCDRLLENISKILDKYDIILVMTHSLVFCVV